jgi:hypothetical protein
MNSLQFPICVVANDAGAANILVGFLRDIPASEISLSVEGPATTIFQIEYPQLENKDLRIAIKGARTLLSGTSGNSEHEHKARILAHSLGVPSIGVIDHWVNYRARFIRNDILVLPDQIWVSDQYAVTLAKNEFPDSEIVRIPNRYMEETLNTIKNGVKTENGTLNILYVLEPISREWGTSKVPGEFQALDYFVKRLSHLFPSEKLEIRLRPHPSEKHGKYQSWVLSQTSAKVYIDEVHSLAEAISWSHIVAGCESFAMVIGLLSGRRTLCTIPPWGHQCRLPHEGIELIREMED